MLSEAGAPLFRRSADFEVWNHEFEAQANLLDLWEYVRPDEERIPWPEEPVMPEMPPVATTEQEQTDAEHERAWIHYKLDFLRYIQASREYEAHRRNYWALDEWMHETVSPRYRGSLVKAIDDLDVRYAAIRKFSLGCTSRLREEARLAYEAIVNRQLTEIPKDMYGWIQTWEETVDLCLRRGVDGPNDSLNLMVGITRALWQVLNEWATSFRGMKGKEIGANTLTHHDIANSLRDYVVARHDVFKTSRK